MAKMKTYTVIYERDEKGLWVAHIKDLAGCHTQGRTLAQARARIREALALFDEDAENATFEDDVRLPGVIRRLINAQKAVQSKQKAAEKELHELNIKAARTLTAEVGLSLRDAGEILGASQESIRHWVGTP
jgi:predicted RNase H-like HicB family nuclease